MVLAVDIGNSNICIGGLDGADHRTIAFTTRMVTRPRCTEDEYAAEMKFLLQRRHSITHLISSAAVIFHGLSDLIIPGCQLFYLLFQFLDLTTTPKKIAVVLKSSTGHGTAWT